MKNESKFGHIEGHVILFKVAKEHFRVMFHITTLSYSFKL